MDLEVENQGFRIERVMISDLVLCMDIVCLSLCVLVTLLIVFS